METLTWIHLTIIPWLGWWCAAGFVVYAIGTAVDVCNGSLGSFDKSDREMMADNMFVIPLGPAGIYILFRGMLW